MSFITKEEASVEIQRLISLQSSVFLTLQQDARTLIDGLATQADAALRRDRAEFLSELGTLREHTQDAVRQGNEKVDEMQALIDSHNTAIQTQVDNLKTVVAEMHAFADKVRATNDETQSNIRSIVADVENLAAGVRVGGGGGGPPGMGGSFDRDRPIFDPRDYKVEPLPSQMTLASWKKWRHDTEIYLDTIGPSWRGVKLLLQQTRHSPDPLLPTRASLRETIRRAVEANKDQPIFDVGTFDFPGKAVILYRLIAPKLNLELSTEFRNSPPDNGI
jgi:hypothetical protein